MPFSELCDDIFTVITPFLFSITEIARLTVTNNDNTRKALLEKEAEARLKQDFYFNESTLPNLIERVRGNTIKAYWFCLNAKLLTDQQETLRQLFNHGLRARHLKGRPWIHNTAGQGTKPALTSLITQQGRSPKEAVNLLDGLSVTQVHAIGEGCLKEEVIDLNEWQIKSLLTFKDKGLTATALQSLSTFTCGHHEALCYLVKEGKDINTALDHLRDLEDHHAHGIAAGLSREEVLPLSVFEINTIIRTPIEKLIEKAKETLEKHNANHSNFFGKTHQRKAQKIEIAIHNIEEQNKQSPFKNLKTAVDYKKNSKSLSLREALNAPRLWGESTAGDQLLAPTVRLSL